MVTLEGSVTESLRPWEPFHRVIRRSVLGRYVTYGVRMSFYRFCSVVRIMREQTRTSVFERGQKGVSVRNTEWCFSVYHHVFFPSNNVAIEQVVFTFSRISFKYGDFFIIFLKKVLHIWNMGRIVTSHTRNVSAWRHKEKGGSCKLLYR